MPNWLEARKLPFFFSKIMPRKKMEKPRKRIGVYIELELLDRFKKHYTEFGAFTTLINSLLMTHLNELDYKDEIKRRQIAIHDADPDIP